MLITSAKRRLRVLRVLVVHVLLPMWFVALLKILGPQDTSTWFLVLISAATYVAYISIAGWWSWFGVYVQRALPVMMIAAAFITRPQFRAVNDSPQTAELRLLSLALTLWFLFLTARALIGRRGGRSALNLEFPLKEGKYLIGQGGASKIVNAHARNASQRYAVDIVKLGPMGTRAQGLYPMALKKYEIFGEQVLSPCEGIVVAARDDLPDLFPSETDPQNPAGNYVAIECEDATVYFAHLMKGSVTVEAGQRVRAGKILGRVGNSGNTMEPHLHVHAEKGKYGGTFSGQPAMRIRFGRRFLVRNDVVEASE
jgi:peptidase M23-like protein